MGAKESVPVEIRGHPEMFYKGAEAAKDGRYQTAEFYFHQALRQHEGREFWVELMNTFYGKTPNPGKRRRGDNVSNDSEEVSNKELRRLDSGDDEGVKEKDNLSQQPSNTSAMKLIDLPLDHTVVPILDYLRMMTDIMNTYLCHEIDDKNLNLAFVHCCYLGLHTQIMYYLLSVWDADNAELLQQLEEGTLFTVDESLKEGKKKQTNNKDRKEDESFDKGAGTNGNANVLATGGQYYPVEEDESAALTGTPIDNRTGEKVLSDDKNNQARKKNVWKIGSRDEMPSGTDILMARKTIYAFVRHYWSAVVFDYCSIALLYIEKRCAPTEVKKRNLIIQNILTASSSSVWDLQQVCEAEKNNYALAMEILKRMPKVTGFDFDAEALKNGGNLDDASGGVSGGDSRVSSQFFASLTGGSSVGGGRGSVNSAMQTFLSISSTFSPVYPLLMDPTQNLPMRLNLRVDTPKSKLCTNKLRPPGSYNLFYYTNWFDVLDVFLIAGYNSRYLSKMLPYYSPPDEGFECAFMSKMKMSNMANGVGKTIIQKEKGTDTQRLASTETQNFIDPVLKQLMEKNDLVEYEQTVERIKNQKSYYNPSLKKNDPYTFRAVVFEEDIIHAAFPILLQSKVFSMIGRGDEAQEWLDFLLFAVEQVYTKESGEYKHTHRVAEMYRE